MKNYRLGDTFMKSRGNVYRMALWIVLRRLSVVDFEDVMDILLVACSIEELAVDEIDFIIDETTDAYLTRKCLFKKNVD